MTDTVNSSSKKYDYEIDLIELIRNLWKGKWTIILSIITTTLLGGIYIFTSPSIFKVSTQLVAPSTTDLSYLNQTGLFSTSPEDVFAEFIEVIESSDHLNNLIKTSNKQVIEGALGFSANDDNIYNKITKTRKIEYPNTNKKIGTLAPEKYFFSYQGIDRNSLSTLTLSDLDLARKTAISRIHERYITTLSLQIQKMEREQILQQKRLSDKLDARKVYVIANRNDDLKRLEEALKIARSLNLNSPSSLSRLANNSSPRQVEINADLNNNENPLYLKGTTLLSAEIENLKKLEDNVFLDSEIRNLENLLLIAQNNRPLEQLKEILDKTPNNTNISFYSENINSPPNPIKPKKLLIIAISVLLGGIAGTLLIAIKTVASRLN